MTQTEQQTTNNEQPPALNLKSDFLKYQAQTSPQPLGLEISHAEGSYIFTKDGKKYLDFIAGVSVCSLGHRHPKVVSAIKDQLDQYLHVMVYGEFAQGPAVELAKLLAESLPSSLEKTYLVNSGAEAVEGALKLARKYTRRQEIIAAKNAYHGSTMGALSLMTHEERKKPFRPLIGGVSFIKYNCEADLPKITDKTAAVILETIQGGAGFILPQNNYLQKVKKRCEKVGALLILDEIQTGFGRTGKLFGFENFKMAPDIIVMGKGMAGGLPIGAFTASEEIMDSLSDNPKMGHITTFGGNPVTAAAALATLREILDSNLMPEALQKEKLFRKLLNQPLIEEIRGKGLMLSLIFSSEEIANKLILKAKEHGLLLFWLLFEKKGVRITPPLTISEEEIKEGCGTIIEILDTIK